MFIFLLSKKKNKIKKNQKFILELILYYIAKYKIIILKCLKKF